MNEVSKKYKTRILTQNKEEKDKCEVKVIEKRSNHTIYISNEKPNSRREVNIKENINTNPNENQKIENAIHNKEKVNYYSIKSTIITSKQNYPHNFQEGK